MTCFGTAGKVPGTICLFIWKQEKMQRAFIALLTLSLGTGKFKRTGKALRSSALICARRDRWCFPYLHPIPFVSYMSLSQVEISPDPFLIEVYIFAIRSCSQVYLHLLWCHWVPEHLLSQQAAHAHTAKDSLEGAYGSDDGFYADSNSVCGKDAQMLTSLYNRNLCHC